MSAPKGSGPAAAHEQVHDNIHRGAKAAEQSPRSRSLSPSPGRRCPRRLLIIRSNQRARAFHRDLFVDASQMSASARSRVVKFILLYYHFCNTTDTRFLERERDRRRGPRRPRRPIASSRRSPSLGGDLHRRVPSVWSRSTPRSRLRWLFDAARQVQADALVLPGGGRGIWALRREVPLPRERPRTPMSIFEAATSRPRPGVGLPLQSMTPAARILFILHLAESRPLPRDVPFRSKCKQPKSSSLCLTEAGPPPSRPRAWSDRSHQGEPSRLKARPRSGRGPSLGLTHLEIVFPMVSSAANRAPRAHPSRRRTGAPTAARAVVLNRLARVHGRPDRQGILVD